MAECKQSAKFFCQQQQQAGPVPDSVQSLPAGWWFGMQPQTRYTDTGERLVACVCFFFFQAPLPQKSSLRILVGRQPPGFVASAFVAAGVVDTITDVGSGLNDGLESLPPLAGCQCWCSTPTEEKRISAEQQRCGKCAAAHTSTTVAKCF